LNLFRGARNDEQLRSLVKLKHALGFAVAHFKHLGNGFDEPINGHASRFFVTDQVADEVNESLLRHWRRLKGDGGEEMR
jgi:hypothetical protein